MQPLRILVVAPDPLARTGLTMLLAEPASCIVVGQVPPDEDLPQSINAYQPDAILWDAGWSPEESISLLAEIALPTPDGEPIVLLIPSDEYTALAWQAGARALLPRDTTDPDKLTAALTAAANNLWLVGPELASTLFQMRDDIQEIIVEPLTPREMEVLQRLAEGLANKEIARKLDITEHTVKFHVNAILGKLGVQSRTEAVVKATRAGLIHL